MMNYQDILDFWFDEKTQPHWFAKSDEFDAIIEKNFKTVHLQATQCELWTWRQNASGRLAEIIVLDQFSRNLYRHSAQAFAHDAMALSLAQEAVQQGLDQQLPAEQRAFLYLPYMHSESKQIQVQSLALFEQLANPINLDFAQQHKMIIDRFGRYPHRNSVLDRHSTADEIDFLSQPNSSF